MKIALVRGPSLTRWELQSFAGLVPSHELTAFVSSSQKIIESALIPCRVLRPWWNKWTARLHPRALWALNGLSSRLFGFSYRLDGLEDALAKFDIVHTLETHNTFSYQAAVAKVRYGNKLVVTVWETIPFRGEAHPLRRSRKKFVRRQADAFIAITERAKEMLLTEGVEERRIHVIPMGIDLAHFSPSAHDRGLRAVWSAEQDWTVVCVARWVREKGIGYLLEALVRLQQKVRRPPVKIVLIGSGPMGKRWMQLVKREGLAGRVVFVGPVDYARIPAVMASADCLVLPSVPTKFWEEQFGYVLIEAMAMGLPIISTISGAIPEVVGDAAILVPPGSSKALAQGLTQLAGDVSLQKRLKDAGRVRALTLYDGKKTAEKLSQLYNSLAKGAP